MELKDFLKLAGQQGKVVVMGEDGNVKGVFLSFDEFQKLSGNATSTPPKKENLAERANREILQAQLEEVISTTDGGTAAITPAYEVKPSKEIENETSEDELGEAVGEPIERLDSLISKKAHELFKSIPAADLPYRDFPYRDYTTPQVTNNSDEEIKPNFEDI